MRLRTLTAIAALALLAGPHLTAQSDVLPTITVTPFTPDRLIDGARETGTQFADELAGLLVDSGRFRVLARDWMPLPVKGRSGPYSVATIRQAATNAGVQYVVFGAMRTSTTLRVVSRQPMPYLPTGRGQLFARILQAPVRTARQNTKATPSCSIEIELIDATSGALIRTMRARSDISPATAMSEVAETLAHLSTQLSAAHR